MRSSPAPRPGQPAGQARDRARLAARPGLHAVDRAPARARAGRRSSRASCSAGSRRGTCSLARAARAWPRWRSGCPTSSSRRSTRIPTATELFRDRPAAGDRRSGRRWARRSMCRVVAIAARGGGVHADHGRDPPGRLARPAGEDVPPRFAYGALAAYQAIPRFATGPDDAPPGAPHPRAAGLVASAPAGRRPGPGDPPRRPRRPGHGRPGLGARAEDDVTGRSAGPGGTRSRPSALLAVLWTSGALRARLRP